ncbi:outer membrane protein RomA [Bacillus sp. JCM 19046]|nr:outer membrane protein RomA [Bacillus sp. JCM 19045]GAF16088.1 outer membrane protein RomA [Bacillus sp. JCM 19046]
MTRKRYENIDQIKNNHTFLDFIKWYKERMVKKKDLSETIAFTKSPSFKNIHMEKFNSITWIGHATFLIQLNGMNILTDPVWSNFMGTTKRAVPNPFPISSLPAIDYVLISHGHFDHLDFKTLKLIPGNPTVLIPSGLKHLFVKKGYPSEAVFEFNWWDNWKENGVSFTFTPAQHCS